MAIRFGKGKIFGKLISLFGGEPTGEIDRELPFAVMVFTLMAASGVTLYESWKRLRHVQLLPRFQKEAEEVVRRVEVLGRDPLTVMYNRAQKTKSKLYRDFLAGYISSVKSGGNVMDFLKSKLRSIFETQSAAATRSVERLGTLVEAYAVVLIVTLCAYILFVVISSTSLFEVVAMGSTAAPTGPQPMVYILVFFVTPVVSFLFLAIANNARRSTFLSLKQTYRKALIPSIGVAGLFVAMAFVPQFQSLVGTLGVPGLVTLGLTVVSLFPALSYYKIAKTNFAAEEAIPSFIQDVTEARKIGLSPEKSLVHASKRSGYGRFSKILKLVRNQLQWGVSLKKIFENVKEKLVSWPVLVNFLVLVQTIEIGGGSPGALEILSSYSEKTKEVEANKRAMLKPYIILAFVWSILIALTTTIVAMPIYVLTQISIPGMGQMPLGVMQQQIDLFSIGIIFQCWMSGFFIGKISEGNFAAGFKYSAMLVITAYVSLVFSQNFMGGMYNIVPS
ncbi:MAG: type II secretion system F family protein [Thermoproteota archaeon]|nr:type II secretion system F family protein [Thermoproteota archaeon]